MIISEEDKIEIERLLNLKVALGEDKASCNQMINKYFDKGFKFCKTCDSQIRRAWQKLKSNYTEYLENLNK